VYFSKESFTGMEWMSKKATAGAKSAALFTMTVTHRLLTTTTKALTNATAATEKVTQYVSSWKKNG
jgi:hypothetical protein